MRVLEVNVDDVGLGGVYALVSNVVRNKPADLKLDIACIAEFENPNNVEALKRLGTDVHFVGTRAGKLSRPLAYYRNTLELLKAGGYDCVHIHGDVAYLLLILCGALAGTMFGLDMTTALSGAVACVGNIGPGFGAVGSMDNFASMPAVMKGIDSLLMLFGRLEIFGLIQLFFIKWWK